MKTSRTIYKNLFPSIRTEIVSSQESVTVKYRLWTADFLSTYHVLLHLPTQMRFLIGGERVTRRGLNLCNSLGRIKLTNFLGKQQLELWTRT